MQDRSNQLRRRGQTCSSGARNLTDVLIERINLIRRPVSSSVCVCRHGASRIDRAARRILPYVLSTSPSPFTDSKRVFVRVFITLSAITACRSTSGTLDNNNVAQQCKTDTNVLPISNTVAIQRETTAQNSVEKY